MGIFAISRTLPAHKTTPKYLFREGAYTYHASPCPSSQLPHPNSQPSPTVPQGDASQEEEVTSAASHPKHRATSTASHPAAVKALRDHAKGDTEPLACLPLHAHRFPLRYHLVDFAHRNDLPPMPRSSLYRLTQRHHSRLTAIVPTGISTAGKRLSEVHRYPSYCHRSPTKSNRTLATSLCTFGSFTRHSLATTQTARPTPLQHHTTSQPPVRAHHAYHSPTLPATGDG